MNSNIIASVFYEYLASIASNDRSWSMPFSVVIPFIIYKIAGSVSVVVSRANVALKCSANSFRIFSLDEGFSSTVQCLEVFLDDVAGCIVGESAGGRSEKAQGSFGFDPIDNWYGLNPWQFWSEFFAFKAQASAM